MRQYISVSGRSAAAGSAARPLSSDNDSRPRRIYKDMTMWRDMCYYSLSLIVNPTSEDMKPHIIIITVTCARIQFLCQSRRPYRPWATHTDTHTPYRAVTHTTHTDTDMTTPTDWHTLTLTHAHARTPHRLTRRARSHRQWHCIYIYIWPGFQARSKDQEILEEGLRWSWTLTFAQKRSWVGRWSWAEQVGRLLLRVVQVVRQQRCNGHCRSDSVQHSSWKSNCAVHKSLGNGEGTPP